MSHEIYVDQNGQASAMYADVPAWHQLGQVVQGCQTWFDTMRQAHMDFTVSKHQFQSPITGQLVDSYGIFRDDNNTFLGAVGSNYEPIQIKYSFQFVDTLLEAENGAHYDSAGVLGKGERFWVSAVIPMKFRIDGTDDIHETYLLFVSSHDGSLAAQCRLTIIRVVCNNTLQQALRMNGSFVKIKHTQTAKDKLEKAKKMISNAKTGVMSLKEKLDILSKRELDKPSFIDCLDRIFPNTSKDKEKMSTRRENTIRDIAELYIDNDNNAIPEIKDTAYCLLNSVTRYTDHMRPTRITEGREMYTVEQGRAESAVFGSGAQFKSMALNEIIEATKNCKVRTPQPYMIPNQTKPTTTTDGLLDDIINETKKLN